MGVVWLVELEAEVGLVARRFVLLLATCGARLQLEVVALSIDASNVIRCGIRGYLSDSQLLFRLHRPADAIDSAQFLYVFDERGLLRS